MTDTINYAGYVDSAMRSVVRDVLRQVKQSGLHGQHHFYISFRTDHPGVTMSDMLRSKYPRDITIVLQHQFWDLTVEQDYFRVTLSFNNIPEKLVVPFSALTGFADPSTKFGLQFHSDPQDETLPEEVMASASVTALPLVTEETAPKESAKVIALDAFRKK